MNIKAKISSGVILTVTLLFFSSFKISYFGLSEKNKRIINSSIEKIFDSELYILSPIDDVFQSISKDDAVIGYLAITDAPSKFHRFDYYILFNDKAEVLKVQVLEYRENYGAEICSKRWLQQFVGIDTEDYRSYTTSVDAISGATISVNSIKNHLLKVTEKLKLKL